MKFELSYTCQAALLILCMGVAWSLIPDASPRPTCTSIEVSGPGTCNFNSTNGVGTDARIVLFDEGPGNATSRTYLRNALQRLEQEHGFELTMTRNDTDITDSLLSNAKVIIFSNNSGDLGGAIPSDPVKARIENFVKDRGWGIIAIHRTCAYIDTWPFLQDVCVQQYYHHNGSGTQVDVYVEDRTIDDVPHGRANPYTNFLLRELPDRVTMQDEWMTWRGAPRTTHQYNRVSYNKIMLLAADESSYAPVAPTWGEDHNLVWTHTMGNGIAIYYSMGHDDVYSQDGERRAYGDTLLWRLIRYAAKDWGPADVESIKKSELSREKMDISVHSHAIDLVFQNPGSYDVRVVDVKGKQVYTASDREDKVSVAGLKDGLYLVQVSRDGISVTRKVVIY